MHNFYGQFKEDKSLYEDCGLNYRNGKFIELGAYDGKRFSNTLFFEETLDWSGVLIEPQCIEYNSLLKHRPKATAFNYAIDYTTGVAEMIGGHASKAIRNEYTNHQTGTHKETTELCKTVPLNFLVTPDVLSSVDLFSIDVEGHELVVLKTFNWDIPVKCVLIERGKTWKECGQFLLDKGFKKHMKLHLDDVWLNPNFKTSQ